MAEQPNRSTEAAKPSLTERASAATVETCIMWTFFDGFKYVEMGERMRMFQSSLSLTERLLALIKV